jgi:hypothetical protein
VTKTLRAIAATGAAAVLAGSAIAASAFRASSSRATDALAVRDGGEWVTWWRRDAAPARWENEMPLADRVSWRAGGNGVEWGDLQLRGASEAWRTRLILVRVDPRLVDLWLDPSSLGTAIGPSATPVEMPPWRSTPVSFAPRCPGAG